MIKFNNRFFSAFFLIISFFVLVFWPFNLAVNALTVKQNDQLIEKIAKDFSKKFCNGIGFGLSEESAKNFALSENIATFKNKKGIKNINFKILADKVSTSVVDKCNYPLELSAQEWSGKFQQSQT
tara:strand:- start:43 stop:417 length:375 start_codon:yes stop_codon:yes gene_type:complete